MQEDTNHCRYISYLLEYKRFQLDSIELLVVTSHLRLILQYLVFLLPLVERNSEINVTVSAAICLRP